jgi:hypothetical protein
MGQTISKVQKKHTIFSRHWKTQASEMQLTGQTGSQAPQSIQSSALIKRFPSTSEMHSTGQTGSQAPQLMHSSLSMILGMVSSFVYGFTSTRPARISIV